MTSPKCKGNNITYQTVTESRKTGCLTVLIYLILAVSLLGLFILNPIITSSETQTVTYAVCQDSGHRWRSITLKIMNTKNF